MKEINQYDALLSLEKALVPAGTLLDGRTEQDWLCFLAEFATLINFYDDNNNISGNWSPFLLKDPLFLIAAISKTRFSRYHAIYISNIQSLQKLLTKKSDEADEEAVAFFFNLVFDELINVFMEIKRWIYYMQRSSSTAYPLKSWLIQQATGNYSKYFWAILGLRQSLFLSGIIPGVNAVDTSKFYRYGNYEETVWRQTKDTTPYWDVLGLGYSLKAYPVRTQVAPDVLQALITAGTEVYNFFHTIILRAGQQYEGLKVQQNPYPDTTLLRAFVNLLQVQQQQLNGLTQKHLAFYYSDILKQGRLPAVADSVFVCAVLAKSTSVYNLSAGTLFSAGTDAQKNPIFFSTVENSTLTQAVLTSVTTLGIFPDVAGLQSLNLQQIPDPSTLQTDSSGKVTGWNTFGGSAADPATLGFVLASPLLFLRGGTRTITLLLTTGQALDSRLLGNASWWLSTATGWLAVTLAPGAITYSNDNSAQLYQATITIVLDVKQPPIEALSADMELDMQWPALKIVFPSLLSPAQPPVLLAVNITVQVTGVGTFQLFNGHGALSTKTSFPLFGTAPPLNNCFMIGNAEIFSKPLLALRLQLNWDNLPADLGAYYNTYNQYLLQVPPPIPWWKKLWNWLKNLIRPKPVPPRPPLFTNECFTVGFQLLEGCKWVDFAPLQKITCPAPWPLTGPLQPATTEPLQLFSYPLQNNVPPASCYEYVATEASQALYPADPTIQSNPVLKFTDASTSGFLKMKLAGPVYGFGAELYPGAVSYVSLYNAQLIYDKVSNPKFAQPAPQPFTPKLSGLSANYCSAQTCSFIGGKNDGYPLQCYSVLPFGTQVLFDNTQPAVKVPPATMMPVNGTPGTGATGISLYPSFVFNGYLFLQLANVVKGYPLNLYFELTGGNATASTADKVNYFYNSDKGWAQLPVLEDSTLGLTCSGIITVNIPADIANGYWLAVATTGNPASFPQTVYLQTNGIKTQRFTPLPPGPVVHLPANTISKPKGAIPQISTLVQPFASFGGKAAEDEMMANNRISQRLKTKDRAVTQEDYYRLVRIHFPDVYFSRAFVDEQAQVITVCVARSVNSWKEAGAFLPLVSKCRKEKIRDFLLQRSNAFYDIQVADFNWQYIQVTAIVTLLPGFESNSVMASVAHTLNLFLSPWIKNCGQPGFSGQSLSNGQVSGLIAGLAGVAAVTGVSFFTKDSSRQVGPGLARVTPLSAQFLYVPDTNHIINCNN